MMKLATSLVAIVVTVSSADAQYAPQIPVESVPDFFQLPSGVNFGEVQSGRLNNTAPILKRCLASAA